MANQSSAASFVTEVLATTGRLEKESFNDKLTKLSSRIESAKDEFCEELQKRHDDFFPNLHSAQELSQRVANLTDEMLSIRKIEQDIRTQLSVPAEDFENLTLQLQETNHILGWLDKLSKIHESMEAVSSAIEAHNYESAVKHWEVINSLLLKDTSPSDSEIKLLAALRHSHDIEQEKLVCSIKESWSERVKWARPDDSSTGETTVAVLGVASTDKDIKVLSNTIQAMHTIGFLENILTIFSNQLKDYVFYPILSNEKVSVNVTKSKEKKSLHVTFGNCKPGPVSPADVFVKLTEVFNFLGDALNLEYKQGDKSQSVQLMTTLGELVSEDLLSKIIRDCLTHSVPSNNKEFENYTKTVQLTDRFNQMLCKIGFIDDDNKILPDFVNNVDMLFSNRKCQEVLVKSRTLMMSDIHNMIQVQPSDQYDELPPFEMGGKTNKKAKMAENKALAIDIKLQALFKMPKCMISVSTKDLVKLVYETLHEATESPMPGAVQLFASAREIIELFCSVVPKYHSESLENLPQLSALHHNNCMYIAHHMMTMGFQFQKHLPKPLSDGMATFIDMVPRVRRLGVECFMQQMNRQKSQLQEYLKGANGFTAVETSLDSAKAVKQVLHHIQVVGKTWKDVLPENIYCKSIGALVNYVISEMISSVTSLEDISEDSANQVHSLMNLITERVPQYFTDLEDDAPIAGLVQLNVKDWAKFKELGIVLDASMQDILDRWADGKGPLAHTFDSNEVKQLIKALFQNNERRANVLSKIK